MSVAASPFVIHWVSAHNQTLYMLKMSGWNFQSILPLFFYQDAMHQHHHKNGSYYKISVFSFKLFIYSLPSMHTCSKLKFLLRANSWFLNILNCDNILVFQACKIGYFTQAGRVVQVKASYYKTNYYYFACLAQKIHIRVNIMWYPCIFREAVV